MTFAAFAALAATLPFHPAHTVKLRSYWRHARQLTGRTRTARNNLLLSLTLSFVAGATNAGGFLAVAQYTSHMTGIVAHIADSLLLGAYDLALAALGGLLAFLCGAICTSVMLSYARRHRLESEYAMPLMLEAVLLIVFGVMGAKLHSVLSPLFVPVTVLLLCFIMGLQNAVATQLSGSPIRTTHVTGTVTDLGVELGKMLYWNRSQFSDGRSAIKANQRQTVSLVALLLFFFIGGLTGAWAFNRIGFGFTLALAVVLILLAIAPLGYDIRVAWRYWLGQHSKAKSKPRQ